MSRIFQALKKAEAHHPPALLASPLPSGPVALPARPLEAAEHALPLRPYAAPVHGLVARANVLASVPEQAAHEMSTLRVSLEGTLADRVPRTVAFVSAQGGEGTSTVSAQFVITLCSDARTRVLFVDANAKRPALQVRAGAGGPLAGLFGAGGDPRATPHVDLMPLPESVRQAGLYSPADLESRLAPLRDQYDWIVIDGPPILYASEAASLGTVADGVVMVVEAGRTKKPVLSRSVDLLRKAGARVMGSVLNRRQLEIPEFIYRRI